MTSQQRKWLIGGLVGLGMFGPGASAFLRLAVRSQHLERRLIEVSTQREQLLQEHRRLNSDPVYVEGLIRSTFKVAHPGEVVIPLESPSDD